MNPRFIIYCIKNDFLKIKTKLNQPCHTSTNSYAQKISDRLLEKFDIGQDGARVALFKYSSNNVMVNEFGLNS